MRIIDLLSMLYIVREGSLISILNISSNFCLVILLILSNVVGNIFLWSSGVSDEANISVHFSSVSSFSGSGARTPPSIMTLSFSMTGFIMPGIDILFLTALRTLPWVILILSPFVISVAITISFILRSSKFSVPMFSLRNSSILGSIIPFLETEKEMYFRKFLLPICLKIFIISFEFLPDAQSAPIMAPMLLPAMTSGFIPSSSSALMNPR